MKRAVIRLPPEVVDRLDALARKLRAAHPGRSCSRAALMRTIIASGLAVAEADRAEAEARALAVARAPDGP